MIKLLSDHGASVEYGQPLHRAVFRDGVLPDAIEVMAFLIDKGADVNKVMFENHWLSQPS